jgi:hypothetical protein
LFNPFTFIHNPFLYLFKNHSLCSLHCSLIIN